MSRSFPRVSGVLASLVKGHNSKAHPGVPPRMYQPVGFTCKACHVFAVNEVDIQNHCVLIHIIRDAASSAAKPPQIKVEPDQPQEDQAQQSEEERELPRIKAEQQQLPVEDLEADPDDPSVKEPEQQADGERDGENPRAHPPPSIDPHVKRRQDLAERMQKWDKRRREQYERADKDLRTVRHIMIRVRKNTRKSKVEHRLYKKQLEKETARLRRKWKSPELEPTKEQVLKALKRKCRQLQEKLGKLRREPRPSTQNQHCENYSWPRSTVPNNKRRETKKLRRKRTALDKKRQWIGKIKKCVTEGFLLKTKDHCFLKNLAGKAKHDGKQTEQYFNYLKKLLFKEECIVKAEMLKLK